MTDDLRDRIAATLDSSLDCGSYGGPGPVADAIVRLVQPELDKARATIARVRDFAASDALQPWVRQRLVDALDPPPPPCPRCHGHGKIPDWSQGLDPVYGEPKGKPCPDCQAPLPTLATPEATPLRTPATPSRTMPNNPVASGDTWELRIRVTAPTPEDAERWSGGIADMVRAEFGDSMRLDISSRPAGEQP